jgi:chaperone required for assembly of F1-ATPase
MKLPEEILTTDIRASNDTYTIMVNEAPLLTPKGHAVSLHSWDLANALADELMAEGAVDLQHVTLYGLYATQRDFVEDRIEGTIGAILQHLPGDFVLHPDADASLAVQQLAAWTPLLAFLRAIGPEVPIAKPLHEAQLPWELTEALRTQLTAMHAAQLTVVLQTVTNLGSVTLGIRLAQQAISVDQAVDALTVTASYAMPGASAAGSAQHTFVSEIRQIVRRLLQYARLGGAGPSS